MSSMRPQLRDTATALLMSGGTVQDFADAGFAMLLVPENLGGIGGDWGDAVAIFQEVGYHAPALEVVPLICARAEHGATKDGTTEDGALACVALIAGAVQKAMELAIDHANVRIQFGKPLSKQQAVQQLLAALAEEAAAVAVAVEAAAAARDRGEAAFEIAAAKIRANRAAAMGAAIAHQIHGAIGFTQEHPLHHYTAALTYWRSAFGSDAYWGPRLGEAVLSLGGQGLWAELTRRSDPGQTP